MTSIEENTACVSMFYTQHNTLTILKLIFSCIPPTSTHHQPTNECIPPTNVHVYQQWEGREEWEGGKSGRERRERGGGDSNRHVL